MHVAIALVCCRMGSLLLLLWMLLLLLSLDPRGCRILMDAGEYVRF
jgi:hypothetical protein